MDKMWEEKIWATWRAVFPGDLMKELEDPGGLVRQVWFTTVTSGGQETTGNTEWKEAVPERASVPPAHAMMQHGSMESFICSRAAWS